MELSVSGCLLLTLSLVSATPYGYGAKSGAVAKAEASAAAGSFDSLPLSSLPVQGSSGFSGSYSKSSSSSFASSSASASSSSFSYSGAGVVPGFGRKLGCEGGCLNGVNKDFAPSGHGTDNNGFGGQNFAGASATAGAVASSPIPHCHGSNCFVSSDKKCTNSNCKGFSSDANRNVESTGNSASESNGNESNDFSVNRPHFADDNHNMAHNKNDDKFNINIGQTSPVVPFDKRVNNENEANCEGPNCGTSLTLTPHGNNNNDLNNGPYQEQACATHDCKIAGSTNQRKPSSYNVPILGPQANLEKENPICTSGNCQDTNYDKNHNYDDKTLQTSNVNKPSTTIQLPTGPSDEAPLCNSKDCHNPSYQQSETAGSNIGLINKNPFLNTDGRIPKPSYNSNAELHGEQEQKLSGPYKPVNPSIASGPTYTPNIPTPTVNQPSFGINPSYYPNEPSGFHDKPRESHKFDNNSPLQTTGTQDSNVNNLLHSSVNSATHPTTSAVIDKRPNFKPENSYQNPITKPTGISFDTSSLTTSGSGVNPTGIASSGGSPQPIGGASSYGSSHKNCISGNCAFPSNPSYAEGRPSNTDIKGPIGSGTDDICAFGNCANGPQLGQPILNKPLNINTNILPPYYSHQSPSKNQFGCTAQNCNPSLGNEKIKPTFPENSKVEKLNPSNTDSEVLLSNQGNKIYSGGFGGPVGILSTNNNGKPSSGIFINPDSGANHNTPQLPLGPSSIPSVPAHSQPISTLGQQPGNMNAFVPTVTNNKPEENKRPYTGGFGGPAGLLKPNEYMIPPTIPKVGCSTGDCKPSQGTQNGSPGAIAGSQTGANTAAHTAANAAAHTGANAAAHTGANAAAHTGANAAAAATANAVSFSGTFGGPPGLLKPYDEGKLDQNGKKFFGKHGNDFDNSGTHQIHPHSNGVNDSRTNAVASASAVAGSYGHPGGCNTGCPSSRGNQDESGAEGHSSGVQGGINHASATASAKSVAGSYAHGRSIAAATAHASAGASAKGGAWR